MPAIGIQLDQAQLAALDRLMKSMGQRAANRALSRAINRTLGVQSGGMRKLISDEIRKDVNLYKSFLYKQRFGGRWGTVNTFTVKRATVAKPTGSIRTKGPNIPLIQYSNQRGARKRYGKAINVQIYKNNKKVTLRHAFIPKLQSGHRGIFVRKNPNAKGPAGRKMKQLFSFRVPDSMKNPKIMDDIVPKAEDRFQRELTHQIDYILKYKG